MKNILITVVVVATLFGVYWFFLTPEKNTSYEDQITLYRHQRAEFYRNSAESPFIAQKVPFTYLDYFEINRAFKIKAGFESYNPQKKLALATSTGTFDTLMIIGEATFNWDDQSQTLLVLGSGTSNDDLFIPFQDATSGKTSYGGGRYLEVQSPDGSSIILDFNKCYNPYCAYTDGYTCPFPPKENRLDIPIEAGEKIYPGHTNN